MKKTEYQCFRNLIEEVFELFSNRKNAYKKYGEEDYKKVINDLDHILKTKHATSITTLKRHLNLKTEDNLPRIANLNLYCKYCSIKESVWCKTEKWHLLLEENQESVEEENKANTEDKKQINTEEQNKANAEEDKPIIVTNIWYTPKPFKFRDFWRKDDEGSLFVDFSKKQIRFESKNTKLLLIKGVYMSQVLHTKMLGDVANSWVKITYKGEGTKNREAWFQDKGKASGLSSMFGGSKELYKLLYQLMTESKS